MASHHRSTDVVNISSVRLVHHQGSNPHVQYRKTCSAWSMQVSLDGNAFSSPAGWSFTDQMQSRDADELVTFPPVPAKMLRFVCSAPNANDIRIAEWTVAVAGEAPSGVAPPHSQNPYAGAGAERVDGLAGQLEGLDLYLRAAGHYSVAGGGTARCSGVLHTPMDACAPAVLHQQH